MLHRIGRWFDRLEARWESLRTHHFVANVLVVGFIVSLVVIELRRQGWVPSFGFIPTNHFYAVEVAFTLLLLVEIGGLIFGLARSVSNAVGKQFEILSLILLRQSFKEFTSFSEPIMWEDVRSSLYPMLSDAVGALLIFVVLGFYYHSQRHLPITDDAHDQADFVATKKLIALLLMATFMLIGVYDLGKYLLVGHMPAFFEACYTVLIFADVLIVLISLRYSTTYNVVFRNSGFAVTTVFIRLALIAPPPLNALLGLGTALFALGLTLAYNTFAPSPHGKTATPH